jgi:hypothetical protein
VSISRRVPNWFENSRFRLIAIVAKEMVLTGAGIAVLPEIAVRTELQTRVLRQVMPPHAVSEEEAVLGVQYMHIMPIPAPHSHFHRKLPEFLCGAGVMKAQAVTPEVQEYATEMDGTWPSSRHTVCTSDVTLGYFGPVACGAMAEIPQSMPF